MSQHEKRLGIFFDEDALKDFHIVFFVERDPGWVKGHPSISVGLVKWTNLSG